MNPNVWLAGGVVGAIAMAWSYIRGFFSSLASIFVESTILDDELSAYVEAFLRERARGFVPSYMYKTLFAWCGSDMDGDRSYYLSTLNKYIGARAFFVYAGSPIWLSGSQGCRVVATLRVQWLRGEGVLDSLLNAAMLEAQDRAQANNRQHERFRVAVVRGRGRSRYVASGLPSSPETTASPSASPSTTRGTGFNYLLGTFFPYGAWHVSHDRDELAQTRSRDGLERAFALSDVMADALEDVRRWKLSERWYLDKSIPWRRGWLFTGRPGTGKSAFVRYIASLLNMPVISFDLSSMDNVEFGKLWFENTRAYPCIALFEDIDCVYNGRTLLDNEQGPSFDAFLNTIGGVEEVHGVCVIVTTNRPETLDEALCNIGNDGQASRPGRIDRVLQFLPEASESQRVQIAANILSEWPELQSQFVADGHADTAAQFVRRCQDESLKRYWQADTLLEAHP